MPIRGPLAAAWLLCLTTLSPVSAANFAEQGEVAYILGDISEHDDWYFQEFLKMPRAAPLKTVYLHSTGGRVGEATNISRMIRRAGLATAINAARSPCTSACTLIFAGGVKRYYISSQNVRDGLSGDRGLGYHRGNDMGATGQGVREDPLTTDKMIALSREMGVGSAAKFARQAPPTAVYYLSGASALRSGVATSLQGPGQGRP